MAQWFVQKDVEVIGPLTPIELLTMVRRGMVTKETKLRKDDSPWFAAADVGGLFEAAVKPTVILHCPGCQTIVSEPPCVCSECGLEIQFARREVIQNRILTPTEIARQTGIGTSMQNWLNKMNSKK